MKNKVFCLSLFICLFFSGCELADIDNNQDLQSTVIPSTKSLQLSSTQIPSTYFDWENATEFNGIGMPWSSATNSFIPNSWRHQYSKEDGWELLYNTLDIENAAIPKILVLYNKYLGIMRFFFIKLDYEETGQKYALAVSINGATSLLNNENDIYSVIPINNPLVVKTQPLTLSDVAASAGFQSDAWYGSEFDFQYENIADRTDLSFQIIPFKMNIEDVDLSSNTSGDITGTIEASAAPSSGSLINNLSIDFSNKKGKASTNSDGQASEIANKIGEAQEEKPSFFAGLWNKVLDKTPDYAQDGILNTVKSVVNMGINWASNPILNFAKSAFGIGQQANTPLNYDVNLEVETKTLTNGTITSQAPLGNFSLALPTTSSSLSGPGFPTTVMQDYGLGVWRLSNLPTIEENREYYQYRQPGESPDYEGYTSIRIKNPSTIIYNPKITEDCDIQEEQVTYYYALNTNATNAESIENSGIPFKYNNNIEYFEVENNRFEFSYRGYPTPVSFIGMHIAIVLKNKETGKVFNIVRDFSIPDECIIDNYNHYIIRD